MDHLLAAESGKGIQQAVADVVVAESAIDALGPTGFCFLLVGAILVLLLLLLLLSLLPPRATASTTSAKGPKGSHWIGSKAVIEAQEHGIGVSAIGGNEMKILAASGQVRLRNELQESRGRR